MTAHWREDRRVLAAVAVGLVVLVSLVVVLLVLAGDDEDPGDGAPPPTSGPTSAPATPSPTGPPTVQGLLDQRLGFGAQVTGGADGPKVRVTTDADSGPGSLREAVAGDQPAWIVFKEDMTITLDSPLVVGSNKTIDGRGRDIEITAPGQTGIQLTDVSNVIIESLTLRDFGDVELTDKNNLPDAINLDHASEIWIDHNDLSVAGDKLIAVTNGSANITVSWNHLHDQEQVFQIGNQTTQDADAAQSVTVHHNFFDHPGYRSPVISYGRAHVFNNYYLDWQTYAVRSERVAQLFLESNVFVGSRSARAVLTTVQGDGCNDNGTRCDDRDGFLRAVGNLTEGARKIRDSSPDEVFDPAAAYAYAAETADQALADRVAAGAGPQ